MPTSSTQRGVGLLLAVACAAVLPHRAAAAQDAPRPTMEVAVATATGRSHSIQSTDLFTPTSDQPGPRVAIDLGARRQRLRGVGAALTESSAYLLMGLPADRRSSLLRELFNPDRGLSVVRLTIGASDFSLAQVSLDDSDTPDLELSKFSVERDRRWVIPVMQEILRINPNIKVVASPWSAPAWMKNSGSINLGELLPQYEDAYAHYLVKYVEAYRDAGIPIHRLTVQNEPAAVSLEAISMWMFPDQQARLVQQFLVPALRAAGLRTKVLTWDHNWCDAQLPGACASNAPATFPFKTLALAQGAEGFSGVAFHCYGGIQGDANDAFHAAFPTLELWQTECSGGTWQADPLADTGRLLLNGMNHWEEASLLWNLALDPDNGPWLGGCSTCRGVVTIDPATQRWRSEVDHNVLATIARFVRPGARVLSTRVSGASDIVASSACQSDGRVSVAILNPSAARAITISFGKLALTKRVDAHSVTAFRAPRQIRCPLPR